MQALLATPGYARQPRELKETPDTITVHDENSDQLITKIRFNRHSFKVSQSGVTFSLSRAYKYHDRVDEVTNYVQYHFADTATVSTWQYTNAETNRIITAPFSIDVSEFYNVRSVVAKLFKLTLLPKHKAHEIEKWVTSVEQYGVFAENLEGFTSDSAEQNAILDTIVAHLQGIESRQTRGLIIDMVYLELKRLRPEEWFQFRDAFVQIPHSYQLNIMRLAGQEGHLCLTHITNLLRDLRGQVHQKTLEVTICLLEQVNPRFTFIEDVLFSIAALLEKGHNEAVDFLLQELKGMKDGELIAATVKIMRCARCKKSAGSLVITLFGKSAQRSARELKIAIEPLYLLTVPDAKPLVVDAKPLVQAQIVKTKIQAIVPEESLPLIKKQPLPQRGPQVQCDVQFGFEMDSEEANAAMPEESLQAAIAKLNIKKI